MASLTFPDTGSRRVERNDGRPAVGARAYLYADAALTIPAEAYADVNGVKGALLPTDGDGRRHTRLDNYGRLKDFWGPADGTARLWVMVAGVSSVVDADYKPRIDALTGGTPTGALLKSANLGDLDSLEAAYTNLELGDAALRDVGTASGTVAAGDDSRITGAVQKSANLSDLGNTSASRTNLGLGDAAVRYVGTGSGDVAAGTAPAAAQAAAITAAADDATAKTAAVLAAALQKADNLAGVTNPAEARTSLGLGNSATRNVGTGPGTVAAGDDPRFSAIEGQAPIAVSEYIVDMRLEGVPYDGTTDGLTAAQAVIDGAPDGSTVIFPPGTLLLGGTLKLSPRMRYQGSTVFQSVVKLKDNAVGAKAVLASRAWATPLTAPIYCGEPLVVEGLHVDGNRANTAVTSPGCHGIVVMNWQSSVTGNQVDDCPGDGIHLADKDTANTNLSNTCVENRVTNNRVYNCGAGITAEDNAAALTDGFCTDNIVGECDGNAIRIARGSGWKVAGNHVYAGPGNGTGAIWVSAGFETDVSDNYVDGFGQVATTGQTYSAIRLDQLDASSSTVHRNRVASRATPTAGNAYRYLHVEVGSAANGVVSVHGNTVQGRGGANETGLFCYAPTGSTLLVDELGTSLTGITSPKRVEVFDAPRVTVSSGTLGDFAVKGAVSAGSGLAAGSGTGQRINLKDAGVPYDGVTDGLTAAQAVIDGAADGTIIEFAPGTLLVSGTLKLKPRLVYRGRGVFRSTVKLMDGATGVLAVMASTGWVTPGTAPITTGDPIIVENIRVDGNKANTAALNANCYGLVVMAWQSTVHACQVDNTPGSGVVFTDRDTGNQTLSNTSVECRITNNRVSGCDGDGILVEDYAGRITDGFCRDNLVAACNGVGIRIKRGAGWLVQGNHVYTGSGRGGSAIWVSAGFATDVSFNYIDYYGQVGSGQFYSALRLDIGGGTGRGCTIVGNRLAAPANLVSGNTYRHLNVTVPAAATSSAQIKNNEVLGSGGSNETGIYLLIGAGATFPVEESGNTIAGVPTGQTLVTSGTPTSLGTTTRGNQSVGGAHTVAGGSTAATFTATGLTGATAGGRFVGYTTTGAPTSGTFQAGDWVKANDGPIWSTAAGGSPGVWTQVGASAGPAVAAPSSRGTLNTGLIPNTTGTQLYPHNLGSGIGTMLSDGGRVTIQGLRTVTNGTDVKLIYGNFMTQQVNPGELQPPNAIRVSASVVYPFGTPKYTSSLPAYSAGTSYAIDDMVVHSGAWYVSLQNTNSNHTPNTAGNEGFWRLCTVVPLYRGGRRTIDIDPGGVGEFDRAGLTVAGQTRVGVITVVEPLTRSGVPVGAVTTSVAYNSGAAYAAGDIVISGSRYYESLQSSNTAHTPATSGDTWWQPIVYPYGNTAAVTTGQPDMLYAYAATAGGLRPVDYTTAPPTTQGTVAGSPSGYGPIAVLMRPAQQVGVRPLIVGVGDSIFNGSADGNLFTSEPGGYFSRAVNGQYQHLRVNKAGDGLRYWFNAAGHLRPGRGQTLSLLYGCTHAVVELGVNDTGSQTSAMIQTCWTALWKLLRDRGILVWQCTITPITTSTDSWATVGNQTAAAGFGASSVWATNNAWLLAGAPLDPTSLTPVAVGTTGAVVAGSATHPLYGVIDIASVVTDATTTWAWKTPGYTADGTHPTSTAYALMAAAVPISAIAAVPPLTV